MYNYNIIKMHNEAKFNIKFIKNFIIKKLLFLILTEVKLHNDNIKSIISFYHPYYFSKNLII